MSNFILGFIAGVAAILAYKIQVEVMNNVDVKGEVATDKIFDTVYDFLTELGDLDSLEGEGDGSQ